MTTHFTQLRTDVITDHRLSLRARALYALMLTKASPDGVIRVPLADLGGDRDGITNLRGARTELVEHGYLTRADRPGFGEFHFTIQR